MTELSWESSEAATHRVSLPRSQMGHSRSWGVSLLAQGKVGRESPRADQNQRQQIVPHLSPRDARNVTLFKGVSVLRKMKRKHHLCHLKGRVLNLIKDKRH